MPKMGLLIFWPALQYSVGGEQSKILDFQGLGCQLRSNVQYRSLIHIGIVELDGRLPRQPSNKHHHHGGAVCCCSGMAVANQSPVPPGFPSKGVGWGRCVRVLFNLADQPREKKYRTQQYLLVLSIIFAPCCHQNNGVVHPPYSPLGTHPLYTVLYCERLLLVGCRVLICQLVADSRHRVFYFHYFCDAPFDVPNDGTAFPHALSITDQKSPWAKLGENSQKPRTE